MHVYTYTYMYILTYPSDLCLPPLNLSSQIPYIVGSNKGVEYVEINSNSQMPYTYTYSPTHTIW